MSSPFLFINKNPRKMKKIALILLLILITPELFSQIGIMPPAVFINPQSRSGSMTLTNSSSEPREVEISFRFGYPSSDSLGNTVMIYNDEETEAKYSLIPYLKVFPRKMIIEAKREQTVRFLTMMPPDLEDGTYWSRVSVLSKPIDSQIDTNTSENEIRAGFKVNTELVNVVIFQKGKQTTGIDINNLQTESNDSLVVISFNLKRTGNAPFWGNVDFQLKNPDNKVIHKEKNPIALYFNGMKRYSFRRDEFQSGKHTIEIRMDNDRDDIPEERKIKFDANQIKKEFYIN